MNTDTGSNDRISLAPPPKRSLPDTSGFSAKPSVAAVPAKADPEPVDEAQASKAAPVTKAEAPRKPQRSATKAATGGRSKETRSTTKAKKTTLHLSPGTVRNLKQWKEQERRTTADAVMSAYISCRSDIAGDFAMTEEDKERAAYGLAPLATTTRSGRTNSDEGTRVVGVYINVKALEDLDTTAAELGLSRSRYADALLTAFLDGDDSD